MRILAFTVEITLAAGSLGAQDADKAPNLYRDQIQPHFKKSCAGCHNAGAKQGGLDLSTREAMMRGSEHGPVVAIGKPDDSQLSFSPNSLFSPNFRSNPIQCWGRRRRLRGSPWTRFRALPENQCSPTEAGSSTCC